MLASAGHWADLHYKGDWLARPIASNEIPPLVRLLVWVSRRLNAVLGLDVPWRGDDVEEPAETVLQEGIRRLRRRGCRHVLQSGWCSCGRGVGKRSGKARVHALVQCQSVILVCVCVCV